MKKYSKLTYILPWFICTLGALFYAYEYFLRITPSVMTDDLMRYYHITDAMLGSLSASYYYIYTPMQIFVGILMDRYGPRRLLTMATICCIIGSILFAATPYLWVASVGRFFIGFGSAFAFVGVLKLATIWLPRRYFALFTGMATALGMLGAIAGDIFLAYLVDHIGWQQTVYLSAGFGIILAILIGLFVRDQSLLERRKSVATRVYDIRTSILSLYRIIRMPQMWIIGIIGGLLYIPTSAFAELWGIPYLQQTHGFNKEQAAFAITMIFWGWVFGGPLVGWVSDTIKRRVVPLYINPLIATIFILLVLYMPNLDIVEISVTLFVFGLFSAAQVLVFAFGRENNPPQASGTAIAFVNMMVMLSGVIFQPLIGRILDILWDGRMVQGIHYFTTQNYQLALMVLPIGLVLAALLARFTLNETYCQFIYKKKEPEQNEQLQPKECLQLQVEQNP